MNWILLLGVSMLLFCSSAQGIVCNACYSGNGKVCYTTEETCKTQFGKCYTYISYLDDEIYFMDYGCVYAQYGDFCDQLYKDNKYTHVSFCCNTDKCNGKARPLPRDEN